MHTSECKKTKRTAHRYRYISVHDASTMNRSVKTIFFVPYIGRLSAHALTTWHTSWLHLGSLLTEKSQQKLCVQCSCCNTWYSGVLGACAQHITTMYKSCTWRTVKLDVLSSEGRFEQTQGYNRSRLQRDNTSLSDLQKETLFKASTLKPCEMIWSQTSVHRVLAENSDLP